ncbi:MAG TPA: hypothetical protein V6C52_00165, partial [Coleofasciculaceae cyanobacterium]
MASSSLADEFRHFSSGFVDCALHPTGKSSLRWINLLGDVEIGCKTFNTDTAVLIEGRFYALDWLGIG